MGRVAGVAVVDGQRDRGAELHADLDRDALGAGDGGVLRFDDQLHVGDGLYGEDLGADRLVVQAVRHKRRHVEPAHACGVCDMWQ